MSKSCSLLTWVHRVEPPMSTSADGEHEPGIRRLGTSIISDQDPGFTDDRDSGSRRAVLAVAVHHIVQVQCANTALSRAEQR